MITALDAAIWILHQIANSCDYAAVWLADVQVMIEDRRAARALITESATLAHTTAGPKS